MPSPARVWLALLACAVGALPTDSHAQQQPFTQGLAEIVVRGAPPLLSTVAVDSTGRIFFPLTDVLQVTETPHSRTETEWQLQWPPPDFLTRFEPVTGRYERSGVSSVLPDGTWVHQGGDVLVDTEAIELLLEATAMYSSQDLVLNLSAVGGFPVNRRQELERQQRARMGLSAGGAPADLDYFAETGGYVLDWGFSNTLAAGASQSFRAVLAGALYGATWELSTNANWQRRDGDISSNLRFRRPFPNNPWLQQIYGGAIATPTPIPVFVDGAVFTNTPYLTPLHFQETIIQPSMPPGWTAEIYDGAHLIGVVDESSDAGVAVPLSYGFTPVRVRMIGPAGQERTEEVRYVIPAGRVPAGRFDYSVGGGRCRTATCNEYGFGEFTLGLGLGATAGIGLDHAVRDSGSATRGYLSLGLNPRRNLAFDMRAAANQFLNISAQYAGPRNTGLQFISSRQKAHESAPVEWRAQAFLNARIRDRHLSISSNVSTLAGSLSRLQVSGFSYVQNAQVGMVFSREPSMPDIFAARVSRMLPQVRMFPAGIGTTATVGVSREGFATAALQLTASHRILGSLTFNGTAQRDAPLSLSITTFLRTSVITAFQRVHTRGSDASAMLTTSGSLVLEHNRRIRALPDGNAGFAGARGIIFLDSDGDGRAGPDEQRLSGITVMAEGQTATSDSLGQFAIWRLTPVRPTALTVDTLGLPDISLTPATPRMFVRLVPNAFTRHDIPIYRTREVTGQVLSATGGGLPGVAVQVRDSTSALVAETRTFADGTYYFARVPPGSFAISVAPASLAALGRDLDPRTVSLTVPLSAGPPITLPPMRVIEP